jgi:hypothetical protein
VEEALFSIEDEVQVIIGWEEVNLSSRTNKKIQEIRSYIECLLKEKKIYWSDIYQLNKELELQNLYDSLSSVKMDKFCDILSYNMWKSYLIKWNIPIVIMNWETEAVVNLSWFKDLEYDELVDLEELLLYSNNAILKVQIWPEIEPFVKH